MLFGRLLHITPQEKRSFRAHDNLHNSIRDFPDFSSSCCRKTMLLGDSDNIETRNYGQQKPASSRLSGNKTGG
jgi:hypothetical protein